jgi:aldose 1-epimerase
MSAHAAAATQVSLAAEDATVRLAPATGGAIASFRWRGHDVLRPTPDEAIATGAVRQHACYPLVPYSNRIAQARFSFDGREHELARNFGDSPHAIHGVGWQRAWRVAASTDADARLVLEHAAAGEDARAWPWPFRATQTFSLAADASAATLAVRLAVENTGDEAFPFGLGFHPFFPKPAGTTLDFDTAYVWENDATQLPVERVDAARRWTGGAPRPLVDTTLDHVFEPSGGTGRVGWPSRGIEAIVDADTALDRRVVFVPTGRDFLAFEPVSHMTDAFNRAARGDAGTGMRVLGPGAAFSCTMRIRAQALS